jgi:xanthine dehydrogenase accessory factor
MNPVYQFICDQPASLDNVMLAVILSTEGSTPQIPGSSALFSRKDLVTGTLGGGVLEHQAREIAARILESRNSFLSEFDLDAKIESDDSAACGGKALILFDAFPVDSRKAFAELCRSMTKKSPGILATSITPADKNSVAITRIWLNGRSIQDNMISKKEVPLPGEVIKKSFSRGKPRLFRTKTGSWIFLEPVFPQEELIIAGAGHIGQAVAHLGHFLNFKVTVIDDREEFANPARLPDADNIITGDIAEALRNYTITPSCYIVIVTRGHAHDAAALRACIASEAGYIGMIGSKIKTALIREKFMKNGWSTPEQFNRVFAPIGIPIPSQSIEEIAVSIAAQLIEVRHRNKFKPEE